MPPPQKRKLSFDKPIRPSVSANKPAPRHEDTVFARRSVTHSARITTHYTTSRHEWERYLKRTSKKGMFVHKAAAKCTDDTVQRRASLIEQIERITGEDHTYWHCVPLAHRPTKRSFPQDPIDASIELLEAISVCVGRIQPKVMILDPATDESEARSSAGPSPVSKPHRSEARFRKPWLSADNPLTAHSSNAPRSTITATPPVHANPLSSVPGTDQLAPRTQPRPASISLPIPANEPTPKPTRAHSHPARASFPASTPLPTKNERAIAFQREMKAKKTEMEQQRFRVLQSQMEEMAYEFDHSFQ
jgi:hypothetical protein